ncbi:MAG: hypothetical protein QXY75_04130 [Candidatus Bathyarchaeia archaeon]
MRKAVDEYGSTSPIAIPVLTILGRNAIALSYISVKVRLMYPVAARTIIKAMAMIISLKVRFTIRPTNSPIINGAMREKTHARSDTLM